MKVNYLIIELSIVRSLKLNILNVFSIISGRLDYNSILTVLDYLESKKCVEWTDRSKKQCHIHWQSPAQWGEVIYNWAQSNGFLNNVVTLDDLIEGDDTLQECKHILF